METCVRRHHREATAAGIGLGTTSCRRKPIVESCVDNTAKLRPQASVLALRAVGANQLLKPASTTPRNYGRRHRSWRADFKHAATGQPRRKPTVETCADTTAKLRPQASVLAPRQCTCNAQRAAPQASAWAPRPSKCVAPRASAGHHDQAPSTYNERRRGKRPGHNDEVPATHNERRRKQWNEHHHHPSL